MAERADAESGDIAGQRAAGRTGRNRRSRGLSRRARLNARRYYRRHVRDQRGRYHAGFLAHLLARGELQVLPRRVGRRYHLPPFVELYDIRFFRVAKQCFWQSALAAAAMLVVLMLVDSIADAALAAGLASSVFIVFLTPSARRANLRHLVGGHLHGLVVGVLGATLLFHSHLLPVPNDLSQWSVSVVAAVCMGLVILLMAATDTDHPPAAATTLGFSLRDLDWTLVGLFALGVLILACLKVLMRRWLKDLVE